jgi:hypothetical protein
LDRIADILAEGTNITIYAGSGYGMAMYSIKAVMHGKAGDVFEMIGENL